MNFEIELIKHETEFLRLSYFLVPWDTELMSRPVAQISEIEVTHVDRAREDFLQFMQWKSENGIAFSSCRIPETRSQECHLVQQFGYRYVELNYRPELMLEHSQFEPDPDFYFVKATETDQAVMTEIAARVFRSGRFHDDPQIGPKIGDERYGRWMQNAFSNSQQEVVKCVREQEIVAFFVQEYPADNEVFWSLVGLAPGFEGKGLGGRIWRSHLAHLREGGTKRISTSISSRNVPVFNLYVSLGFRFPQPSVTFHWHAGTPGP